ncbi:DUF2752 domain-containing protein [Aquimarina intermedia]|uniref:DUF2752 domain-containing protein n=1 Tax=Aquimarina intermedia TaxID=350814 RepID=UPI0011E86D43|nr:DUF2752 domain-containing protein [Aquimarina intermedia]
MEKYMFPCLNKKLFGVDCLGCGLQRSLSYLAQGEFAQAFKMYPAVYPLLLLLAFWGVTLFFKFRFDTYIKYGLLAVTVLTIIISYFIKMNFMFN